MAHSLSHDISGIPAITAQEAKVCRRLWKHICSPRVADAFVKPILSTTRLKVLLNHTVGFPCRVVNTGSSGAPGSIAFVLHELGQL